MISSLKNDDGLVYAYIEWQVVNSEGDFENKGYFVYIQDCWVHKDYRNSGCINKLIPMIHDHEFAEKVEFIYWKNLRHGEKKHMYRRSALAKKGAYNGKQERK